MAINFRDLIIDRVEELLVWGDGNTARTLNQSLQLQETGSSLPNSALSRSTYTDNVIQFGANIPENGFFSRVWKINKRPSNPQLITEAKLLPSAFIYVDNASRPADVAVQIGNISEALFVGIEIVMQEGFGVQQASPNQNTAQLLPQQVNAFVTDFDVLFNGTSLMTTDFSSLAAVYPNQWQLIQVVESGVVDWFVGPGRDAQAKATDYEILTFSLQITLTYPQVLDKAVP